MVRGAGPIGLLTAQHARHAGAGAVLIVKTITVAAGTDLERIADVLATTLPT